MLGLLRDWLLDPAALLFLASIVVGLVLVKSSRNSLRKRARLKRSGRKRPLLGRTDIVSFRALVILGVWFVMYAIASAPILVNPQVNFLEKQHDREEPCAASSHIVLLSGGVSSRARSADQFDRMSNATFVRATEAYKIISEEPDAKLIISGGKLYEVAEAQVIGNYLESLGVPEERIILEEESRNTYENALNVAAILANEDVQGPVRLVSSAMHMHRAMGSFKLALSDTDISVCPVSVDFLGLPNIQFYGWVPQVTALKKFDHLIHEVVALLVYKLKGWI
ncbi:MAG: YdcF family protein [Granulosicoccus sp.]